MRNSQLTHIVRSVLLAEASTGTEEEGPVTPSAEVIALIQAYFSHINGPCMNRANEAAANGATAEEILDIILDPACQNEDPSDEVPAGVGQVAQTTAWVMANPAATALIGVGAVALGVIANKVIKRLIARHQRKKDQLAAIEKIRRRIDVTSRTKTGNEGPDFADLTEEEILAINRANPHALMVQPGNKIEVRITNPTNKYFVPQSLTFAHHYYVSGKIMDKPYLVGEKMTMSSVPLEGPGLVKDYAKRDAVPPSSSNTYLISIDEAIEKASKPPGEKRDMFAVVVPMSLGGVMCPGLSYEEQYRDGKAQITAVRSNLRINRARNRYEMDTIGMGDTAGGAR